MNVKKIKNRWLIALSAVGIHISIGSVYAWSIFTKPLIKTLHVSMKDLSFTFSLAIIFLGLSAAFMGKWVEKQGPKKAASLAATFFGVGLAASGLAVTMKSLLLLYISYGVISGIGLGIGYISPVSTLVKWFPDKRGLATGLAIMGFGFASLIASPIIARLIQSVGIPNTFFILGIAYFFIMMSAASFLAPPPEGWLPAGFKKSISDKTKNNNTPQLTANEALKTKRFYFLWIMLFINITCGIAIISVASPMAQEIAKLSPLAAATMVGFMGLFNGGGRIGWASLSDYIGRPKTYILFFVIQIVAFFMLPKASSPIVFQLLIFIILTCYGGGFASIPAYIGDFFGTKQLAAIHGYILTAWAAAGYIGPTLVTWIKESTNSYEKTLYVFVGGFAVALATSVLAKLEADKIK